MNKTIKEINFKLLDTYLDRHVDAKDMVWDVNHPKIVIWSGGADSTLLLYETGLKCKERNMPVDAIHINVPYLDKNKCDKEKECREYMLERMKAEGIEVKYSEIKIDSDTWQNDHYDGRGKENINWFLPQQMMWTILALQLSPDGSDVFFGYIRHDDFFSIVNEIKNLWYYANLAQNKNIKFHTPYESLFKHNILSQCMEYGIFDHTWTCENPIKHDDGRIETCKTCHPCESRRDALFYLACNGNLWAERKLEEEFGIIVGGKIHE